MTSSPTASPSSSSKSRTLFERLQLAQARMRQAAAQPEESIALRVLVQLLVSVGIASISVASAGVVDASLVNLLAIPMSAVGGYWSWRSRHRSNITVKFILAFGMLMALGIFLSRLVGSSGDTRIRLAELLIHLQVLHSFDMPKRKDLGYSIVIGLILLGVAATVSQTLTLAPVLIAFLAIVLPVLILDYRSRLGLKSWQGSRRVSAPVDLKRLGVLLLLVSALGLAIFAALPRLPGYQVRNFPVSDTLNFQGEFEGDQIFNPGYTSGGDADEDGAGGSADGSLQQEGSPEVGPGQMSGSTYYGFNQRMNQNLRGTVTPQVMMRVRSQAVGFWRVLAFDRYTGQGWTISDPENTQILNRSSYSYQTYLPPAAYKFGRPDKQGRRRDVVQTYSIVNELPNLIPALYQAGELYFPTRQVAIDSEGALRAPLPLSNGLTFTVVSEVPYRDRTLLREAGTDYDAATRERYLQVPEAIQTRVQQRTEELLARSPQPLTDPYEKALFLAQTLKQTYTVQEALPFFDPDEDLVEAFLFRYEGGYGDHFATVLTVMLRSIGIPARLATGFAPGRFNAFTGYHIVNNTDAFALTEVYFPGYGWFAFDAIPGHEVIPPSIRDSQTFGVLRQFWNWVAGWLPSPVAGWLSGVFGTAFVLLARLFQFFSSSALGLLAGLLTAVGLAFLGWLSWQGWRRWRRQARLQKLPPIEQVYQQLLAWLADQGYPKHPHQTPLEYAIALNQKSPFPQSEQVAAIVEAYVRWRYGDRPEDPAHLKHQVTELKRQHRFGTSRNPVSLKKL